MLKFILKIINRWQFVLLVIQHTLLNLLASYKMKLLKEQLMKISKALVFDIKRFAIHDGSGLRTTIFFKGCPLRCLWCQNPEGLNTQRQVIYFKNKCIHCRCCQQFKEQINYQNDRPYFKIIKTLIKLLKHVLVVLFNMIVKSIL